MKKVVFIFLAVCQSLFCLPAVELVVFSYDRPMQLYAFLESLQHGSNLHQTSVIFRCSGQEYRNAYEEVFKAFANVKGIEQTNPPYDFKSLLIQTAFCSESADYITFAVDDNIVTDLIDFEECAQALETSNAFAFYLRMGKNIEDCWSTNAYDRDCPLPPMVKENGQIYAWIFASGLGDWAYPQSLDMTIFRKLDIEDHLEAGAYFNPNMLEDYLGSVPHQKIGLCFRRSRALNLPLNIVSSTTATGHLNISAEYLLQLFNAGLKIDITPLFQYQNRSTHVLRFNPTFVKRDR